MAELELPLSAREPFYQAVWDVVRQIPAGQVSTYGQVGSYIPCPEGVNPDSYPAYRPRWVGNALSACPGDVPWQRVINSQGKISLRRQAERQRALLEAEGVIFDAKERVNLARYAWEGPPTEWLRQRGLVVPDEPAQPSLFG